MSRKILSSSDTDKDGVSENGKKEPPVISSASAKFELVKPAREPQTPLLETPAAEASETAANLSPARPKVGRVPAVVSGDAVKVAAEDAVPVVATPQADSPKKNDKVADEPANIMAGLPRPAMVTEAYETRAPQKHDAWDIKFAVILVVLLVLVNFALVTLLHNHHKAGTITATAQTPALVSEGAASSAAPAASLIPLRAPAPANTATDLKDLPAPGASAPVVSAAPAPVVAPVAAAPAPVAPAPITATPESHQDLLTILNKE